MCDHNVACYYNNDTYRNRPSNDVERHAIMIISMYHSRTTSYIGVEYTMYVIRVESSEVQINTIPVIIIKY